MSRKLKIGDKTMLNKTFSEKEVEEFAKVSTDDNPIHLDKGELSMVSWFRVCSRA
jgi:acyl dehydratase